MYQTSDWSIMVRAIMDISARTSSLPERPQRTIWVTSVRMRLEDRTSVSSQQGASRHRTRRRLTLRHSQLSITNTDDTNTNKQIIGFDFQPLDFGLICKPLIYLHYLSA